MARAGADFNFRRRTSCCWGGEVTDRFQVLDFARTPKLIDFRANQRKILRSFTTLQRYVQQKATEMLVKVCTVPVLRMANRKLKET